MSPLPLLIPVGSLFVTVSAFSAEAGLLAQADRNNFPLVTRQAAAAILIDSTADQSVARAADDLRHDIQAVTDRLTDLHRDVSPSESDAIVIIGVVGQSSVLQQLSDAGKVDLGALKDAWESFIVAVVDHPLPNVRKGLVIAGSDNRGAIYGCYEISEAIGVSPWHWWADVHPDKKAELFIASDARRFGPPSVKYRGIFINDEDWGLQPWAAKTFDPEAGDIGPKTYAKVFELLLRLKANTLWPAMHPSTRAFNGFPENKETARRYGIVMGSSHAEPMLRNNVGEWKEAHERYNYIENRDGVLRYWEQRVEENSAFENIYTLGMRGIHDTSMQGNLGQADRIKLLEQIFADQRALLAKHVSPEVERIPQMFCAYKEVLDLYRGGLRVPDDVTIVWPDDNHGYIRNFATTEEQKRSGGAGVYYHLSYLGAPMSYLWLNTIPPALIWEEMHKAYENGARTIWIVNVGDIKPAEIGIEFFLRLAWDVDAWTPKTLPQFLPRWAAREFGSAHAEEVASILAAYYQLNFQRKPEHLQWWMPQTAPRPSPFTRAEAQSRLSSFLELRERTERLASAIPANRRDAFYQLVTYPVVGSALVNERYFYGELATLGDPEDSEQWLARAKRADLELRRETARFNDEISGGKWKGIMQLDVAGDEWPQFQIESWRPPMDYHDYEEKVSAGGEVVAVEAEDFTRKVDRADAAWELIPGLGRTGKGSVALYPTTVNGIDGKSAPRLEYTLRFSSTGEHVVHFYLIPTHPIEAKRGLRFAIALDDGIPQEVVVSVKDGSAEWAQGVLNATLVGRAKISVAHRGAHTLHILGVDAGVVIDRIVVAKGTPDLGYLGAK